MHDRLCRESTRLAPLFPVHDTCVSCTSVVLVPSCIHGTFTAYIPEDTAWLA